MVSTDQLIVKLVDHWDTVAVSVHDGDRIAQHVAAAQFATHRDEVDDFPSIIGMRRPRVPTELIKSGTFLDTLERHTASRIADGDLRNGATVGEYLASLQAAASHASAKVLVGYLLSPRTGRCRYMAATFTESTAWGLVLPGAIAVPGKSLIVYYEVGKGVVTGYMIESAVAVSRTEKTWKSFRLVPR